MTNQKILRQLAFHNPWWETGGVPKPFLPAFKRFAFNKILAYLALKRIIIIKGPRRTGKTTLFYQLIDYFLKKGVNPQDVLYLSFDDPLLKLPLEKILEEFAVIRGKSLTSGKTLIFLDEAQFLPNWELIVKLYYDRHYPIDFFVSGSAISLLTQRKESLAGRTIEEVMLPFSFAEVAAFELRNPKFQRLLEDLGGIKFEQLPQALISFESKLKILLSRFLKFGGFPHLLRQPPEFLRKLLQEDVVQKVVFRDLVELFNIREPSSLEKLLNFLGQNTASIVNLTTLSSNLGISRPAVEQYIAYLEQSLLFFRLRKFSHSPKERLRSNPKGHVVDPGLGALFGASNDQLLETAVAASLFAKHGRNLSFWRDQNHEVDLVIENKDILPIEVKNTKKTKIPNSLSYFMNKQNLSQGIVVYQGDFAVKKEGKKRIYFTPAFSFLLCH